MWKFILPATAAAASVLAGCDGPSTADYDRGYGDGLKSGYAASCRTINERSERIAANWKNKDYTKGFIEGQAAGTTHCNTDRRQGVIR